MFLLVETIIGISFQKKQFSQSEPIFASGQLILIAPATMNDLFPLRGKGAFTRINKKTRRKWFPIVVERLLYKNWLHHNSNNGFH